MFNNDGSFSFSPSAVDQLLNDGQSRIVMFDYVANDGVNYSQPATQYYHKALRGVGGANTN
ncbi:MAG: hypothetical protein IPL02_04145 [Moraxellaceae bacterium]|nr:hypothetical protein [Moraxellaceae bacterium]